MSLLVAAGGRAAVCGRRSRRRRAVRITSVFLRSNHTNPNYSLAFDLGD